MGYTHYWRIGDNAPVPSDAFGKLAMDAVEVIAAAAQDGIALAGGFGTGDPEVNEGDIRFNGASPDTFETFSIRHDSNGFTFCKTGERPYDAVVRAVLLLAAKHYGGAIEVSSDGSVATWEFDTPHLLATLKRLDAPHAAMVLK